MKCSRVLITGATGLLGSAVVDAFRLNADAEILGRGRHELDITSPVYVNAAFESAAPDLVINCAAFTRVDDCELRHDHADRVNGDGAGNVARAARTVGADLIHISTDYIFNGSHTSPIREDAEPAAPAALSAYGRSKLLGECRVRECHPDAVILRTAWLFGRAGPCFPAAILKRAREGLPLRVVNDQRGAPTYVKDLAFAIFELAQHQACGTYHFTNAGDCTWHEYAGEILKHSGIIANIEPVSSEEFDRPAKRPAYSVLDMTRFIADTGHSPRPWQAALAEFLQS